MWQALNLSMQVQQMMFLHKSLWFLDVMVISKYLVRVLLLFI